MVDEIHQELLKRLEPLGVKIARREILSLFEAYCTLLRASSEAKDDVEWVAQVEKHGGSIVSVDGLQEDAGNQTVYLVQCYDREDFPRPNNDMERSIRGRKHAVSPREWSQELDRLSVALWVLCGLRGLVGARRGPSKAAAPASRPT